MNCPDLKAYMLGEVLPEDGEIRVHLEACLACRLERERLEATSTALRMLPDEEIPVHIRFVSDKVFAPRWWERFGVLGRGAFAASVAILVPVLMVGSAFLGARFSGRNGVVPAPVTRQVKVDEAAIEKRIHDAVEAQVNARVAQLASELERRNEEHTRALLADFRREERQDHEGLIHTVDTAYQTAEQRMAQVYYVANEKVPARVE